MKKNESVWTPTKSQAKIYKELRRMGMSVKSSDRLIKKYITKRGRIKEYV